jgi:adenine phosphoribosyltransferase
VSVGKSLHDKLVEQVEFYQGHAEIWRVFEDRALFGEVVNALAEPWKSLQPTKVAGVEARGFILGGAVAHALGVGFVAIRKEGPLFAGSKVESVGARDYRGREHRLRLRRDSLEPSDRVVLIDDWCETGSQATTAMGLIESCGAAFLGVSVVVDELPSEAAAVFPRYRCLVRGEDLHGDSEPT